MPESAVRNSAESSTSLLCFRSKRNLALTLDCKQLGRAVCPRDQETHLLRRRGTTPFCFARDPDDTVGGQNLRRTLSGGNEAQSEAHS